MQTNQKFAVMIQPRGYTRLGIWFVLSVTLPLLFFRDFWTKLLILPPNYPYEQFHALSWAILALCLVGLYLKREEILAEMSSPPHPLFILVGVTLVVCAVLMPASQSFLVFRGLLTSLGVFAVLFGRAARIPAILLAVYGVAVFTPSLVYRFFPEVYSATAVTPLVGLMSTLGYPIENYGQLVQVPSPNGDTIAVLVTAACAGPATMGVFVALFALMRMDMHLPLKTMVGLFLFGALGTWLQSLLRLIILIALAYYWGESALWTAHQYSIYILFPLWYLLFAYIYLRQVARLPQNGHLATPR